MNILLADDHALFRESLSLALMRLQEHIPDITQASSSEEALRLARKQSFDLILLDIDMSGVSGLEAVQKLQTLQPNTPIIMISAHEEHAIIQQALSLGAQGFIPKTTPAEVTLSAIKLVLSGGTYLPVQLMQEPSPKATPDTSDIQLSPRQIEVLRLLQQGEQNKNIAHKLNLSISTVKVHIRHIFTTLGARNRTEAVDIANRLNLL